MTIRPATDEDTRFARAAHHAAYHDLVLRQFGEWDPVRQDGFFDASWSTETHAIVLRDDRPCGYYCVEDRIDDVHLRELVIAPEFQSRGIGTLLLRQFQDDARKRDVPIRLGTFHENRARRLYERLGFREIARSETHVFLEWRPS